MSPKKATKNFAEVIRAELAADHDLAEAVEEEKLHADIAEQILNLRTQAKLTQKELAEKVETKQSVISRIEDADYSGHSLSMLQRIAHVFGTRLVVLLMEVNPKTDQTSKEKHKEAGKKAAITRKRREAGLKAAGTRKKREEGRKAARTKAANKLG